MGLDSYVTGALRMIRILDKLEKKKYQIADLVGMGLL